MRCYTNSKTIADTKTIARRYILRIVSRLCPTGSPNWLSAAESNRPDSLCNVYSTVYAVNAGLTGLAWDGRYRRGTASHYRTTYRRV
jgi:hypothetical protein